MSIFISIASYKDPETIPTIFDAYNKAYDKSGIRFGVLLQEEKGFSKKEKLDKNINVDFLEYDWRDSQGACWARNNIQKLLFNNEDYYFQLDSHHRFCEHWDKKLIDGIKELGKNHKKPIIGGYCPGYEPGNDILDETPMRIASFPEFTDLGDLMFIPKSIDNYKKLNEKGLKYIKARFLSGHFIFTNSIFVKECPYDPLLYFRGEELSLSARAYTSGYDFFHPVTPIVWHEYLRVDQTKHWNDHTKTNGFLITSDERSNKAKQRVRQLLGMEVNNIKFNKYGLGNKRSLHEYELYAGLNFSQRLIHKYAYDINKDAPEPYIMKEKEWEEGMLQSYEIEFAMPENHMSSIIKKNAHSFAIIFYDSNDRVCYRKDIKSPNFSSYNTKITKIKGNMTNKPTKISLSTFFKNDDSYPNQHIRTLKVIK
jgi:hypothetical protein